MKNLTAALVLSLAATSAFAWGDREQGILAGAAGVLILNEIFKNNQQAQVIHQPQVVQQPQVIYSPPPQVVVVPQPSQIVGCVVTVYDQNGRPVRSESRACVQTSNGVSLY